MNRLLGKLEEGREYFCGELLRGIIDCAEKQFGFELSHEVEIQDEATKASWKFELGSVVVLGNYDAEDDKECIEITLFVRDGLTEKRGLDLCAYRWYVGDLPRDRTQDWEWFLMDETELLGVQQGFVHLLVENNAIVTPKFWEDLLIREADLRVLTTVSAS